MDNLFVTVDVSHTITGIRWTTPWTYCLHTGWQLRKKRSRIPQHKLSMPCRTDATIHALFFFFLLGFPLDIVTDQVLKMLLTPCCEKEKRMDPAQMSSRCKLCFHVLIALCSWQALLISSVLRTRTSLTASCCKIPTVVEAPKSISA